MSQSEGLLLVSGLTLIFSTRLIENFHIPVYIMIGITMFTFLLSASDFFEKLILNVKPNFWTKLANIFSILAFWGSIPISFFVSLGVYKMYVSMENNDELAYMSNKLVAITVGFILMSIAANTNKTKEE